VSELAEGVQGVEQGLVVPEVAAAGVTAPGSLLGAHPGVEREGLAWGLIRADVDDAHEHRRGHGAVAVGAVGQEVVEARAHRLSVPRPVRVA
jgi:hypothetical protein